MKTPRRFLSSALLAALVSCLAAQAAPVIVSDLEYWDGEFNPHESEGVTLTGSGTPDDPAVYAIPDGLKIAATGQLLLAVDNAVDKSIQFSFLGGDFEIEEGGVLNIARLTRNGRQVCILDLGGGSIKGAGRILGLQGRNDTPRVLTIQNVRDVALADIDLHVENVNNSGRHLNIAATGTVKISQIDNSDRDPSGNPAPNVTVRGEALAIGQVDTRAMRADGQAPNGNVVLQALGAPEYDPARAERNGLRNTLSLDGAIETAGPDLNSGTVTLQCVVAHLQPGFALNKNPDPEPLFEVGLVQGSVTQSQLFRDEANSGLTPFYSVLWSAETPRPVLSINREAATVVLRWTGEGFTLQENASVANAAGWVNVPGTSPVTRPIGATGARFYRLTN